MGVNGARIARWLAGARLTDFRLKSFDEPISARPRGRGARARIYSIGFVADAAVAAHEQHADRTSFAIAAVMTAPEPNAARLGRSRYARK